MKKYYYLAICAIVSLTLTGCFGGSSGYNDPSYSLSDLQTLWQEDGTEHFVRFTTEITEVEIFPPSYYGREWDEAEEITEQDLVEAREELGHPGNGWFKYEFKTSGGDLTEIHLMDNGGAEIPKIYIVSKLTSDKLEYYEKDHSSSKYYFSKVVTTNLPD